ncbi:hypothetical protein LJB99_00735 [Deltaproteobacteria bacterium OttesenSCG-928-K17]|nr:hypothetical protein [Deltaproteobacteria bacterium OttesenSCG-928-K17]
MTVHDYHSRQEEIRAWQSSAVLEIDQDEARKAFVGRRYRLYKPAFEKYDENGGAFFFSFHWQAFVAGGVWYLYRHMYSLGIMLALVDLWLLICVDLFSRHATIFLWLMLILRVPEALVAQWFFCRLTDEKIEKAIDVSESEVVRAMGWLKYHGQGNLKVSVVVSLILSYVAFLAVLPYFVLAFYAVMAG